MFVAGDAFAAAAFLTIDETAITLTVGGAGALPGGVRSQPTHQLLVLCWVDLDILLSVDCCDDHLQPLRMRSLRHRTAGWEWICDDGVPAPGNCDVVRLVQFPLVCGSMYDIYIPSSKFGPRQYEKRDVS